MNAPYARVYQVRILDVLFISAHAALDSGFLREYCWSREHVQAIVVIMNGVLHANSKTRKMAGKHLIPWSKSPTSRGRCDCCVSKLPEDNRDRSEHLMRS